MSFSDVRFRYVQILPRDAQVRLADSAVRVLELVEYLLALFFGFYHAPVEQINIALLCEFPVIHVVFSDDPRNVQFPFEPRLNLVKMRRPFYVTY